MLGTDTAALATPRGRRRERTRQEILDAAWELCREHGLAALSLRELAARVGMRAPSLYSYFESKHAIFDAMFAEAQHQMAEDLAFVPETGAARADLRSGAHAFFEFCIADPTRYQLMFLRSIPGFEPSGESYALAVANFEQTRVRLAAAGIDDPRQVDLWTATMTGLTSQQMTNDPGGDRWHGLLDEAIDMLCDHVGIPE